MKLTPLEAFAQNVEREGFVEDDHQKHAVAQLQSIYDELTRNSPPSRGLLSRVFPRRRVEPPVRGLYLWGGVGRGKTYLMDCMLPLLSRGALFVSPAEIQGAVAGHVVGVLEVEPEAEVRDPETLELPLLNAGATDSLAFPLEDELDR